MAHGLFTLRRAALVVSVVAIAIAGWWLHAGRSPRGVRPTTGTSIVMLGDSLVEGVGASPGRDLPALVAERVGLPVVNAGHRGDTASAALARLERDVLGHDPRVVIVLVGGNDFLRRVPRAETFDALGAIVGELRARGVGVVVVAVGLGLFTDEYAADYETLATRTGAALVPDVLDGILGRNDLMSDQIHPNDRGCAIMADRIAPSVRSLVD
jgi:acyl-CoA thioesterase-1